MCKIEQTWTGDLSLMPVGAMAGKSKCSLYSASRIPAGPMKITTATRKAALEAANDFLNLKMLFVTISADGRMYTAEEFATTMEGVRER